MVKINEVIKNAVVSHKALIESDLAEQREAIIASLEKGQVLEGLVKNITDFGAFLDLGGVGELEDDHREHDDHDHDHEEGEPSFA